MQLFGEGEGVPDPQHAWVKGQGSTEGHFDLDSNVTLLHINQRAPVPFFSPCGSLLHLIQLLMVFKKSSNHVVFTVKYLLFQDSKESKLCFPKGNCLIEAISHPDLYTSYLNIILL